MPIQKRVLKKKIGGSLEKWASLFAFFRERTVCLQCMAHLRRRLAWSHFPFGKRLQKVRNPDDESVAQCPELRAVHSEC
jgi:hypothetical protein